MTTRLVVSGPVVDDGLAEFSLDGELDLGSVDELAGTLERALGEGARDLILDLSKTSFIDSTGLKLLIEWNGRVRENGGQLLVAGAQDNVRKTLELTGLDRVLSIAESGEQARATLSG